MNRIANLILCFFVTAMISASPAAAAEGTVSEAAPAETTAAESSQPAPDSSLLPEPWLPAGKHRCTPADGCAHCTGPYFLCTCMCNLALKKCAAGCSTLPCLLECDETAAQCHTTCNTT